MNLSVIISLSYYKFVAIVGFFAFLLQIILSYYKFFTRTEGWSKKSIKKRAR